FHGVLSAADLSADVAHGVTTFADFVAKLRAGAAYVNVHTAAHTAGEIRGQLEDSAGPVLEEFIAQASDFQCLTNWNQVRHYRIPKALGHEAETLAIASGSFDVSGLEFPVGTIVQLIPNEAMVKRGGNFDPANHDWEYFTLRTNRLGTRIVKRGR